MSSANKYPHQHMMTSDITANVEDKVRHYLEYPKNDDQELKLIVYGDDEPFSFLMWKSILRDDLPNMYYSTVFPLIPTPAGCTRALNEQYENELKKYVAFCVANKNLLYGLYNVAAPKQEPRMHLVLLNRRVKRSELGRWAQTDKLVLGPDKPTPQRDLDHLSAFRERSILRLVLNTEGGGTSSFLAFTEAYLRKRYPTDGGESDGMMSLLVQSSQGSSFSDLNLTDSGKIIRSRTTEGSSRESISAGDRSSGGSAASLSFESSWACEHYDRFIPIHSFWVLVWNLLDFFPLTGEPLVSTSTSSSFEDICPHMAELNLVPSDGRPTEPSSLEDKA